MQTEERAVDTGAWDGGAAYKACNSASDYASVCAGRRAGDPSLRSTWALPHHMRPGAPPNADGVRSALSRLPQTQGLTNAKAAKSHLEAHMSQISPKRAFDMESLMCPWCHGLNDSDAIYCDQCGRSLAMVPPDFPYAEDPADTVKCPACGRMNGEDAHFCDQCSAGLDQVLGPDQKLLQLKSAAPNSDLFRAVYPGTTVREAVDGQPVLTGHFARFNEWTEIDSTFEGRFMERIAPGAFKDSFTSLTPKAMFQHGRDPEIGDKVLGAPVTVREDDVGAAYEVPLFPSVPPLLLDGLRAGAYGASFRFSVTGEDVNRKPQASDYNPEKLPERTITSARVAEFGPVTFPAYAGATAGIRSITDEFHVPTFTDQLAAMAREKPAVLAKLIEGSLPKKPTVAKPPEDKATPRFRSREEFLAWMLQS